VCASLVLCSWFREKFCDPSSTADFQCTVPFSDNATETKWCLDNFNATDCTSIRNSAQNVRHLQLQAVNMKSVVLQQVSLTIFVFFCFKDMGKWILGFYYVNASIGLTLICLVSIASVISFVWPKRKVNLMIH
jgi:hypothetical protein